MAQEQYPAQEAISYELGLKLRDLEENQRLMKERILLVGQNLIDFEDKTSKEISEVKKSIYELKSDVERIKGIIQSLSEEIEKSARREELAILSRQFKMFEPLKFARIEDIDKIIEEKLNDKIDKHQLHNKDNQKEEGKEKESHPHAFWMGKT
ncbi:hypothetical protein J4466_02405 [Candidatus Pacearchaeota archaeon]|nr:hypothetical protein [Candidatus Pacearchaeota archaeon]